jgi:hypothetical protein
MDYIGLLNVLVFDKTDKAAKLTDLWYQINYNLRSEYSSVITSLWKFNIGYTVGRQWVQYWSFTQTKSLYMSTDATIILIRTRIT